MDCNVHCLISKGVWQFDMWEQTPDFFYNGTVPSFYHTIMMWSIKNNFLMKDVMLSMVFFKWASILTTIIWVNILQKLSYFPFNSSMKLLNSLKNLIFGLQCICSYFPVSIIYESDKVRCTTKILDFHRTTHVRTHQFQIWFSMW